MHELSIALSILDLAAEEVERQGGGRITAIHLKLGTLAGVVKDALVSAFELAREGTSADKAELVVEDISAEAFCPACSTGHMLAPVPELLCPTCGTPTPELLHGRELEVIALEIVS